MEPARRSPALVERPEQELHGGTTPGVVRVGDTVRKPSGPWTGTVDAVLRHLERCRFPAPRPLGTDAQGRHTISWVPGETTYTEHARWWGDPAQLARAARLLRRMHDALDHFTPAPDARWRAGWGRVAGATGPICHWDVAPWNVVAGEDGSLSVIDWDGVGPGDRTAELAYAIHGFVPMVRDEACADIGWGTPPDRVERTEAFVSAYGLADDRRAALADAIVANAHDAIAFLRQMVRERREPWASRWTADGGAAAHADLAVAELTASRWTAPRRG